MSTGVFNAAHKDVLDSLLLPVPGVVAGTMFGYPAYYIGGKLFACLYREGVAIKVPGPVADSLVGREGIVRFQPRGRRPMKEWIQINRERSEDYRKDRELFKISIDYMFSVMKQGNPEPPNHEGKGE
jgi:hypothetical protein